MTRIAIPMPHSIDHEYGERAIPQYERAVALVGGEPVRIPLDRNSSEICKIIDTCDGVLLPGSNADIDPAKFHQQRSPHCASADARREQVDALLLEDAYAQHKPVLGICYGLQSLNVYRRGSLVQHIPEFLPEIARTKVNHEAGRKIAVAHIVEIESGSLLAEVVCRDSRPRLSGTTTTRVGTDAFVRPSQAKLGSAVPHQAEQDGSEFDREGHGFNRANKFLKEDRALAPEALILPVNSSHHQSADTIGDGLRIVARCPDDGIIEALEGTSPDHFVLSVQWHPERSVDDDEASRSIFRALIDAAQLRR